jgi:hypothetical protein
MTGRVTCAAAAFALGAAGSVAAQGLPQGAYELEACSGNPYSDARIEIAGNRVLFYESACTQIDPEPVRGMEGAVLYDGDCAGEGMEWQTRYMVMPGWEERLVLVQERWAGVYAYCGPAETPVPGAGSK